MKEAEFQFRKMKRVLGREGGAGHSSVNVLDAPEPRHG